MNRRLAQLVYVAGIAASVLCSALVFTEFVGPARFESNDVAGLGWWLGLGAVIATAGYGLGLPELPARRSEALGRGVAAVVVGLATVSAVQLITASLLFPRSSILVLSLATPIWITLSWRLVADLTDRSERRERLLVVTDRTDDLAALTADLRDRSEVPATLVAALSVDEARGRPDRRVLVQTADTHEVTVIVLDRGAQADDLVLAQVAELHQRGVRVRTFALFYEEWLGKLPLAELAQVSLLFDIGELHRIRYARTKRIGDVVVGVLGTVGLVCFLPVVLLGNLVGNRGPLLFRQDRVGRNGEVFSMLKFRTMTGSNTSTWTTGEDMRITPFGRFLRKTHLDELPQMVNIVRGQLSLVGPRPEQVAYVEELRTKIPFYDARHIVRPGLTGWAQVKLGYASSERDAVEKLQYDFFYLRRSGIALDLRIMGRTIREVLGGLGR